MTQLAQISIFPEQSTNTDNIVEFPKYTPKHIKHPQQRVSPIRDPKIVDQIIISLKQSGRHGLRNATIFVLQLSIGRRTNDILRMHIQDVYDYRSYTVKSIITVDEHKTGKTARDLPLGDKTRMLLQEYIDTLSDKSSSAYLFPSQKRNTDGTQRHLNTSSLNEIYKEATEVIFKHIDTDQTHISSYAARKTFGWNIYQTCMKEGNGLVPGTDINALQYLQSVYNHDSTMTTLRYIGAYDSPATKLTNKIADQYTY